jgi:hypothetical protein
MNTKLFIRLLSACVIGGTLAHRGIFWYQPSFWVLAIATAVYAVATRD